MQQDYVVTGSLTDSRTVRPDEPIPMAVGKVHVIAAVAGSAPRMSHEEFLAWLRERHEARGDIPRTREQVDVDPRILDLDRDRRHPAHPRAGGRLSARRARELGRLTVRLYLDSAPIIYHIERTAPLAVSVDARFAAPGLVLVSSEPARGRKGG